MSTSEILPAAGVDVGAGRVHVVRLDGRPGGRPAVTGRYRGPVCPAVLDLCAGAVRVAVDAPGGPSRGAHRSDPAVAPKFQAGRCSEVPVPWVPAVPWVTPMERSAAPGWMLTGFEVWDLLAGAGVETVETFPAAGFHRLNGGRWPPAKSTRAGRLARLALLGARVELPADADRWSHDDLDAALAALVAAAGEPLPHNCARPDGSAMWLPAAGSP